jgi:hypothetical protein
MTRELSMCCRYAVNVHTPQRRMTSCIAFSCESQSTMILRLLCTQSMALKLGVATERDLAQCCRDMYPRWAVYLLWIVAEVSRACRYDLVPAKFPQITCSNQTVTR